ncbi:hypothetical protein GN244_ATG19525 [Phytophthora infestans]|uniref:Thioredoxin-like fold domain-containing protein n=1 Tax=Phytophthora infestans TaxID=4787 RepID=A0A833SGJ6_PHYIN|nr:hypothetical protein GN244_ATG19525 [Phytophthora infestans]
MRRGETSTQEALANKTVVGLYFTASPFPTKTIPTLIFVDANGDVVEREGRRSIENNTTLHKIWDHVSLSRLKAAMP